MWQSEGTLKQMSFSCIQVTKEFVIAFMERKDTIINNHLQMQQISLLCFYLSTFYYHQAIAVHSYERKKRSLQNFIT